jgi:hypothetical protein
VSYVFNPYGLGATATVTPSVPTNIASIPLCAAGVDNWPQCNPVSSSGQPCYGGIVNGAAVATVAPEYCNPLVLGAVAVALLIFAPGMAKIAAVAPIVAIFLPTCSFSGCPGSAD